MGLFVRWFRRLAMTRLKSLHCLVWIASVIVVTFMLISVGKLHNRYEREPAASLEFYPEGRRVLSVQHQSKDAVPVKVPQQRHPTNSKFDTVQLPAGNKVMSLHGHVDAVDTNQMPPQSDKSRIPYGDLVPHEFAATEGDDDDDLSHFEELDGFNYVANKEKREAAIKLSNNIKIHGDHVVMEELNKPHRNEHATGKESNNVFWNPRQNEEHDKSPFVRKRTRTAIVVPRQDDLDDLSLHEQQLLETNIVGHKPIKPNLPPEDENYDTHLSHSHHNERSNQYSNPNERQAVKTNREKHEALGNQVQFYESPAGNDESDLKLEDNQMKRSPPELGNLNLNAYEVQEQNMGDAPMRQGNSQPDHLHQGKGNSKDFPQQEQLEPSGDQMTSKKKSNFLQKREALSNPNLDNVQLVDQIIQQQTQTKHHRHETVGDAKPRKRRKKKKNKKSKIVLQNNTSDIQLPRDHYEQGEHNEPSASLDIKKEPQSVSKIYMKPNGRIGNQMFEIASAYGIARRAGRKAFMSQYSDIYQIFPHANKTVAKGEAREDLGVLFEEKAGVFSGDLFSLPPTDLVLCCYFQSWKYFEGYETEVKKMFHFRSKIRKLARNILSQATGVFLTQLTGEVIQDTASWTLTYIGVHVRRGDLQLDHHVRRGYRPAPLTYFHKAMAYFRQHFSNVLFLVTSDDMEWCKVKLGSSDVFFVEGQHEAVDLAVLSMTNHTVISVGTFSWWAGWLAGGQVIYYKNWLRPDSEVAQLYQHKDYFLPKWRSMGE